MAVAGRKELMKINDVNGIQFDEAAGFDGEVSLGGEDGLPLKEIYGGDEEGQADQVEQTGSSEDAEPLRYYFYPTWRSQIGLLTGFFVLCGLTIAVSKYLPWLIVGGNLFSLGNTTYYLYLPIVALVPGALLGKILIHIYDAKYIIDEKGVEAQIGLMSLSLRQPRLRWEDIRGVEPNQTIWERILGIGSVLVGSAMTEGVEITMKGVANPRAVQLLINAERERRMQELSRSAIPLVKHMVAYSE